MKSLSSFKKFGAVFAAGVLGGVVAVVLILPFLARFDFWDGNRLIGSLGVAPEKIIERIEEKTVIVPQQDVFVEAVKKAGPSVVSVQAFGSGRLVRSGSGIILTQDGLIATLTVLVPPDAEVVQVVGGSGQIWRGKVERRDYRSGVALVSVLASGLVVARMNDDLPAVASGLLALGKIFRLGVENILVEEALVSWADERAQNFGVSIGFNNQFYGAALIDGSGAVSGLVNFVNQKPVVVFSNQIQDSLDGHLSQRK